MSSCVESSPADPALLAFYLPQFHPVPENDQWWGPGFTEWRNVIRGRPLYDGHYQPHLPGELGFYDLRVPEVRGAQAMLAEAHGITGFCYYHYWFMGRRLLEMPFDEVLRSGKPDFPFCLCWANESWTRNWDGGSREVLVAQRYSPEDDRNHIRWLINAFRDPRYIRVANRPVLFIYNVSGLPHPRMTTDIWREECALADAGDPYLVQFETFGLSEDPAFRGCDAAAEFLPHFVYPTLTSAGKAALEDPERHNEIFRYDDLAEVQLARKMPQWRRYQCVVPNWDNTPRKPQGNANLFLGSTPEQYELWLAGAVARAKDARHEFVLVNAWNEWAESAHLEPDLRYGRAYLEATARAVGRDPVHRDVPAVHRSRPADRDAVDPDDLRRLYDDHKASSATEIEALLRQVQSLEDALLDRAAPAPPTGQHVDPAELLCRLDAVERRLSVRAANAIGRVPIAGRTVRMLGILRREWSSL